jgi:glycosyltransferase involved in cell wall biosynthesis
VNPLVSVVITTYNRPVYLQEAIESVVQQTYDALELIVVDGHSTESPAHIVNAVDQDRFEDVIFIRHGEDRGVSAARNTGIEHASGEYIALLDDDDLWTPDKIEQQVQAFEQTDDDDMAAFNH